MATRKIDSLTKPNQHDDLVERHASARLAQVEREKARTYQKNPRESWFGQLIMGVIYAVLFFAAVVPAMYLYKIWGAVWGLLAVNVVKFLLITMLGFLALSKNERKERV